MLDLIGLLNTVVPETETFDPSHTLLGIATDYSEMLYTLLTSKMDGPDLILILLTSLYGVRSPWTYMCACCRRILSP